MGVKGLKECGNLGNFDEAARHTLAPKMLLPIAIANKRKSVRAKIDAFGLPPIPGIKRTHLCTVAWVICHGTKFKSAGIMICNFHKDWAWSVFGELCVLCVRLLHKLLGNFLATFGLSSHFCFRAFIRQLMVFRAFFRQLFSIRENISFLSDKNLFFMHFLSNKTNKYPC